MSAENDTDEIVDGTEETWNDWVEDESRVDAVRPLLSDAEVADVQAALQLDKSQFGLDLASICKNQNLDYVGLVRVVNFVRRGRAEGKAPAELVQQCTDSSSLARIVGDDSNLKMVLANDRLIYEGASLLLEDNDDDDDDVYGAEIDNGDDSSSDGAGLGGLDEDDDDSLGMGGIDGEDDATAVSDPSAEVAALKAKLRRSTSQNQQLVQELLETKEVAARLLAGMAEAPAPQSSAGSKERASSRGKKKRDNDTYYFDSYSTTDIHREMISDRVRTSAYRDAILGNPALFRDKVVLDVGCGTGILSLFAAKAGARKVIGVDMSTMTDTAQAVANKNGFGDVITIVRGKAEEVSLPLEEGEKVDVIISEWMGYALLYECMLQSVLVARDRFLAPGGTVLPNKTTVVIEAADELPGTGPLDFWDEVYGFDLSPVKERVRVDVRSPIVKAIPAKRIASSRCIVHTFDCRRMGVDDVDVLWTPFSVTVERDVPSLAFFVLSFDTLFDADGGCVEKEVEFRTDAAHTTTHWMQTLLRLKEPLKNVAKGTVLAGEIQVKRNESNPRELDITLRGFPDAGSVLYYHME